MNESTQDMKAGRKMAFRGTAEVTARLTVTRLKFRRRGRGLRARGFALMLTEGI